MLTTRRMRKRRRRRAKGECVCVWLSLFFCACDKALSSPRAVLTHIPPSFPPSPLLPFFPNSREKKKRSADKTETRKQYVILAERAGNLWRVLEAARKKANSSSSNNNLNGESGGGASTAAAAAPVVDRPRQANMMALLREIASLPNIELPPGGTCMHMVVIFVCTDYPFRHPQCVDSHHCLSLYFPPLLPPPRPRHSCQGDGEVSRRSERGSGDVPAIRGQGPRRTQHHGRPAQHACRHQGPPRGAAAAAYPTSGTL